jgi:hypothetical protein
MVLNINAFLGFGKRSSRSHRTLAHPSVCKRIQGDMSHTTRQTSGRAGQEGGQLRHVGRPGLAGRHGLVAGVDGS